MSASDFPRPFGVPVDSESRGALAGPESAAEHLRNALQVIDDLVTGCLEAKIPPSSRVAQDVMAVRRRVAAALALLEGEK